jgi:NAD(P)H-dependent FMN reductase
MPIYCYSVSGVLKNFIDIFSQAFRDKYFGIFCAAGSKLSYLATSDLIKMLGFESNATDIQPIVMADNSDFSNDKIINKEINERTIKLIDSLLEK